MPEVSGASYSDASACGTRYDFYRLSEFGELRYAGRLSSTTPTELSDRYLLWEIQCEGVSTVRFAVGRVDEAGTIRGLGTVQARAIGVRAESGSHRVEDDGTITFDGRNLNGDTFVDTFQLSDLLDQLPAP